MVQIFFVVLVGSDDGRKIFTEIKKIYKSGINQERQRQTYTMNLNINLVYDLPGFSRKLPWMQDNDAENDQFRRIMREEDRPNFVVGGRNDFVMDQIDFDRDLARFVRNHLIQEERSITRRVEDDLMLTMFISFGLFLVVCLIWIINLSWN